MIEFNTVRTPGTENWVTVMDCPHCGSNGSYHIYVPETCEKCGKKLPDVINMQQFPRHLLCYHRSGVY